MVTDDMKKPREFWIRPKFNWIDPLVFEDYDPGCLVPGVIHVREVLPDEPDWKSLCAELAEALEKVCKRNDIEDAVIDYYSNCSMILEKYNQVVRKVK